MVLASSVMLVGTSGGLGTDGDGRAHDGGRDRDNNRGNNGSEQSQSERVSPSLNRELELDSRRRKKRKGKGNSPDAAWWRQTPTEVVRLILEPRNRENGKIKERRRSFGSGGSIGRCASHRR